MAGSIARDHVLESLGIKALDGAVLDLGLSSDQLEDPERGFSFRFEGPLDMRFDLSSGYGAMDYLKTISVQRLEEILATYGEERYCKKLARGIIRERDRGRLENTKDLAQLVARILGRRRGRIHPATRTFQALRVAVNKEMENLAAALEEIPPLLKLHGRLCVVSYHSLEDRQVKQSFRERQKSTPMWKVVTKRPIRPTPGESKGQSEIEIRAAENPGSCGTRQRVMRYNAIMRLPRLGKIAGWMKIRT
jgi:16S rRNA (cytosine1402-N4)-methyltransferase